jgi:hypothetical protein
MSQVEPKSEAASIGFERFLRYFLWLAQPMQAD